jgi:hypothetical protein
VYQFDMAPVSETARPPAVSSGIRERNDPLENCLLFLPPLFSHNKRNLPLPFAPLAEHAISVHRQNALMVCTRCLETNRLGFSILVLL